MSSQNAEEYTAVPLPRSLVEQIEARIRGTGFASAGAYVAYVLSEVLSGKDGGETEFTPEDEEALREKLHALGYLG
jgi:hypothetical protein